MRSCLEHRHSYVRKNAVFAVYSIYRAFEHLIPDAPELVHTFLVAESDSTCKRNAFLFLANCAMPKAIEYVMQVYDQIPNLDESLQMSIVEVIRMDCKVEPSHKVISIHPHLEIFLTSTITGSLHQVCPRIAQRHIERSPIRGRYSSHDTHAKRCCHQGGGLFICQPCDKRVGQQCQTHRLGPSGVASREARKPSAFAYFGCA